MDTERTCGECTLCCKTHAIIEFMKPAGAWCIYCEVGKGCAIYNTRPESCQQFECAWLMGFGRPEFRPDKTQIIPDFREIPGIGLALYLWEGSEKALDSEFVKRQTRLNLKTGKSVLHIPIEDNPKLYLPEGKMCAKSFIFGEISGKKVEIMPYLKGRF